MKKRVGFVSNSSSTSFVVVGVEFNFSREKMIALINARNPDDLNHLTELFETDWNEERDVEAIFREVMENEYAIYDESETKVIGIKIAGGYDELDDFSLEVQEAIELSKKVSEELNVPIGDVKIYGGTDS